MENIDELIARLAQDTALVKIAPHPFMLTAKWTGGAVVYLLLSLMFFGMRPDLMTKLHETWFAAEIASLAGVLISTALSAALLSYPDLHQKRRIVFAPIAAFALFALVIFFAWRADSPSSPLPIHNIECTRSITMISLLPAALMFYAMRKFASTHYLWSGTLALLFAFSVGALWERLHEQTDSIIHVIEWHYLPIIGFGIIGMWLGKALLKW